MEEEEGCFDPVLSVKFEQALFFRGFSGDRRQARDAREGGGLFLAPSTVVRVSHSKIACGHRRISGRRVRLPSLAWKT